MNWRNIADISARVPKKERSIHFAWESSISFVIQHKTVSKLVEGEKREEWIRGRTGRFGFDNEPTCPHRSQQRQGNFGGGKLIFHARPSDHLEGNSTCW